MGYTHYYKTKKKFETSERQEIVSLLNKIIDNLPEKSESSGGEYSDAPLKIAYTAKLPYQKPVVDLKRIIFNGFSDNPDDDLGHESFYYIFDKPNENTFTKTAYKPYDYVVQAALMIMHYVNPKNVKIGSDGNKDEWEWSRKTASDVLGIELKIPDTI